MGEINGGGERPVLYYDGECGLCSRVVRTLAAIDARNVFAVSPLQGVRGQEMLRQNGMSGEKFDTMIVEVSGKIYGRSDAVIEIFRQLGGWWRVGEVGRLLPRGIRDSLYMLVSRNRLKMSGRNDSCPLPSPATRRKLSEKEFIPPQVGL